jgi:signal transduction histidine kinase
MVRLNSAKQTLRDIAHALGHDLRTSLRHVVSHAQMMGAPTHGEKPDGAVRLSHRVLDASRQLQRLKESMSALARLQVGLCQRAQGAPVPGQGKGMALVHPASSNAMAVGFGPRCAQE